MLEIHLFVNPLGSRCFQCEHDVLKVDQKLDTKVNYRFIPFFNMETIQQTIDLYQLDQHSLAVRQCVSNTIYRVILDYMAASFQGRKRGRQFLLVLQSALINNNQGYSIDLVKKAATEAKLDLEMFMEDRDSQLAKGAFHKEQQTAKDLGITKPATAVIFDTEEPEYGFLFNHFDYETLIKAYYAQKLDNEESVMSFIKNSSQLQTKLILK